MAIYDSRDKIEKWRYEVKQMYVLVGGTKVTIPNERIVNITISHDYLSNLYPILKLKVILSSDTYYEIQKNKNNLKFFLRVDKFYYYEDKTKKADGTQESAYKAWINDTFDIIMDNNTEDMDAALEREESKSKYTDVTTDNSDELHKIDNNVTFYLYKTIAAFKTNVNKVFTNVNITDAIVYLMSQAKLNNVIMQQPENSKKYKELVIPPLSISKALYFLDTYYGIYKMGTLFYSDFNYTYIIPFDASNRKAFLPNEIKTTNFVVPKSGSKEHSSELGVIKKINKDNSNYIVCSTEGLSISNTSISNDLISGSDAKTIDSFSGSNTDAKSNATTKTTKATTKLISDNTENAFFASMQSAVAKSLSTEIKVKSADFDIDMVDPHKNFTMMFEDPSYTSKYQGKYMVTKAEYSFDKEGMALAMAATITLRKMK